MRHLKATTIKFPEYHRVYNLSMLGNRTDYDNPNEKQKHNLSKLFQSLDKHGMVHPIIISYNGYQVSVGHQRVWYARQRGYTHIDCYHISNQTEWEQVFNFTANEEYLND
jgi:hypothetical protein